MKRGTFLKLAGASAAASAHVPDGCVLGGRRQAVRLRGGGSVSVHHSLKRFAQRAAGTWLAKDEIDFRHGFLRPCPDFCEAREQNHRMTGVDLADRCRELHAVHVRHAVIRDHQIEAL